MNILKNHDAPLEQDLFQHACRRSEGEENKGWRRSKEAQGLRMGQSLENTLSNKLVERGSKTSVQPKS